MLDSESAATAQAALVALDRAFDELDRLRGVIADGEDTTGAEWRLAVRAGTAVTAAIDLIESLVKSGRKAK